VSLAWGLLSRAKLTLFLINVSALLKGLSESAALVIESCEVQCSGLREPFAANDSLVCGNRKEELASNPDARFIPFISVSTDPRIRSDGVGTPEGLSPQNVEQYYVPCKGEVPRPRLLWVGRHGSNRERREIGDPCFDFADHGFAMDRRARIRLLAAHQDRRTRVLHPWKPFYRRHLAEKHDARLVSSSGLRRTVMGVLGEVSEDA
jgi:hypothetical protein